jgi:PIN like domain
MSQEKTNPFILSKVFPDYKSILSGGVSGPNDYSDYLYVLDTNTLLAPYGVEKESMEKIKSIYASLISTDSLYVPIHAAREFAENRPSKVRDIFTKIDTSLSTIPGWQSIDYPMLHELDSYKALAAFKDQFKALTKQYRELLQSLLADVTSWNWQDPVTKIYGELFKDEHFISCPESEEDLMKDLTFRFENNIPPGFKDKGKSENSAGDLIIWKTILALGKGKARNVVFVTNEGKPDWFVRGNNKPIVTRFELVDEFYRETQGKHFTCMNFSSFLELHGASAKVVQEVQVVAQQDEINDTRVTTKIKGADIFDCLARIEMQVQAFLAARTGDFVFYLDTSTLEDITYFVREAPNRVWRGENDTSIRGMYGELLTMREQSEQLNNFPNLPIQVVQDRLKALKGACYRFLEIYTSFLNNTRHARS